MAEFNELVKNFGRIREHIYNFYLDGTQEDREFKYMAVITYDGEEPTTANYPKQYLKRVFGDDGKVFLKHIGTNKVFINPIYIAWKSKSFTANDIMLHFYILDVLKKNNNLSIKELTENIYLQSGKKFDIQAVRSKCNKHIKEGLVVAEQSNRALSYNISSLSFEGLQNIAPDLLEAVRFFQGVAPFGVVGSFILDSRSENNNIFTFKHNYILHTLEDEILIGILSAIRENKCIEIFTHSGYKNQLLKSEGVPLKIFTSNYSGRRFLCMASQKDMRIYNYRIDKIKTIRIKNNVENYEHYEKILEEDIMKIWSLPYNKALEFILIKFYIDEENESHILDRIRREGRNGKFERVRKNIYLYSNELFDSNDILAWLKTFIGSIIMIESTNQKVITKFYNEVNKMAEMYKTSD